MQQLPLLTDGSAQWSLPLSPATACGLSDVLLCDQRQRQVERLRQLLAGDPAFALWTISRVCLCGAEAHGLDDLADWLADHALDQLVWTEEVLLAELPAAAETLQLQEGLVCHGLLIARLAAHLADGDPARRAAELLGMLTLADQWLACCRVGLRAHQQGRESPCLPDLLDRFARRIASHFGGRPRELVVQSRQLLEQNSASQLGSEVARLRHQCAEAAMRWAACDWACEPPLRQLVCRLRRLRDLESRFAQVLEHEKLLSLKQLAYGASHEINNPLANIAARAQALLQAERDPRRQAQLAIIGAQAFRAHEMIADMMLFAHPPELQRQPVDPAWVLEQTVTELAEQTELQKTTVTRRVAPGLPAVYADPTQLVVAVKALVANALEAVASGGHIELAAQPDGSGDGNGRAWVQIRVRDDGPGMGPEVRRHIFDPFFSGREAGRGLGFGLPKCWRIVQLHGGRIDVESQPGEGSTFTIRLPVCDQP